MLAHERRFWLVEVMGLTIIFSVERSACILIYWLHLVLGEEVLAYVGGAYWDAERAGYIALRINTAASSSYEFVGACFCWR